jgi:hypothetical protein
MKELNGRAPAQSKNQMSEQLGHLEKQPSISEHLRAYLQLQTIQGAGSVLSPREVDQAWDIVAKGLQMEVVGRVIAGFHLKALKASLPSGEFCAALAERNIARSTSNDAINTFDLFNALPSAQAVESIAQIGVTKAFMLRHWSVDEIGEFVDGAEVRGLTYETATELSTRELIERQRQWLLERDQELDKATKRAERAELAAETARNEAEAERLKNQARHRPGEPPDWFRIVRHEASCQTEEMLVALDLLTQTLNAHLFGSTAPDPELSDAAAGAVYHALRPIALRAANLLARIHDRFGEDVTGAARSEFMLMGEEAEQAERERRVILQAATLKAKNREVERANSAPGRKGRKRKTLGA